MSSYTTALENGLWTVKRPDGSTVTRTAEGAARFVVQALNAEIAPLDPVLQEIRDIWARYPDLRFTQLLLNVLYLDGQDYHLTDEELLARLRDRYSVDQPGGQG